MIRSYIPAFEILFGPQSDVWAMDHGEWQARRQYVDAWLQGQLPPR